MHNKLKIYVENVDLGQYNNFQEYNWGEGTGEELFCFVLVQVLTNKAT